MMFEILNILCERKGLCSDPDMLSCMGWTAMWCRTLFLLLSSPFHLVSFLDILVYRVGRVTSVLQPNWKGMAEHIHAPINFDAIIFCSLSSLSLSLF